MKLLHSACMNNLLKCSQRGVGKGDEMLHPSGNFQCQFKKSLCELSPSSQATLQRSCKQAHYEKGVQHGKIGTGGYGGVKADV